MPRKSSNVEKAHSRGVGLFPSEWAELDRIAGEVGMTPHTLVLWILRRFIEQYNADEIPTRPGKRLV